MAEIKASDGPGLCMDCLSFFYSVTHHSLSPLRIRFSFFCKQPRPFYQAYSSGSLPNLFGQAADEHDVKPAWPEAVPYAIHKPTPPLPTGRSHTHPIPIPAKHRPSLGLATGLLTNVAHRRCSDSGVSGQHAKRSKSSFTQREHR